MEQLTSTPQRVPETNAEYEKLIGDNCSVYSDVSRLVFRERSFLKFLDFKVMLRGKYLLVTIIIRARVYCRFENTRQNFLQGDY